MSITIKHKGNLEITDGTLEVGPQGPQGEDGTSGPQGPIGPQGIGDYSGGVQGPQGFYTADLSGTNSIFVVSAAGTDEENATELQAAYDAAKFMSPGPTNRITIVAAPGYYNFGTSTFTMDTPYIDLVSLDGGRNIIFNANYNVIIPAEGSISITANDVFVKGVDVQTKAFTIAGLLNLLRVENCKGGDQSFGGFSDTTSGTFIDCIGGVDSWSAPASGTYINCVGGNNCFGSGASSSGVFINCTAGLYSFGGSGAIASGTFTGCKGGLGSFAGLNGTASGIFIDCQGGDSSFGSRDTGISTGNASGTFTRCQGGSSSFGGNGGTASGTFVDCIGGDGSFGGNDSLTPETGTLSGKLHHCRLTTGTFQTVSGGGRTYYCVDGNGNPNNQ
jgi:hypothetical protein